MSDGCRVCGHADLAVCFTHPDTPLFVGIEAPDTPPDLVGVRLPISLVRCAACQTIQQPEGPRRDALLDKVYFASHGNAVSGTRTGEGEFGMQRAQQFLDGVGIERAPPRVLEVGCNQGHMLALMKDRGAANLVGVEPSAKQEASPAPGITIVPGYFNGERFAPHSFDLVYMIEVLEHIPAVGTFLRDLHRVLGDDGRLAISVPNCASGFEFGNIGMPIHEHLLYFTPNTLRVALQAAGFEVERLSATFSHLYCLAKKGNPVASTQWETVPVDQFWRACTSRFEAAKRFAADQIAPWGLYGACSLTTNLLAWCADLDLRRCSMIDADPNKWGRRVSGCPTTISPAQAVADGIRRVLVMPFGFQENIERFLRERFPQLEPTLLFSGLAARYAARPDPAALRTA